MGRERGVASARSQPLGGAAAQSGTPKIDTSTSKPPCAFCWEAIARSVSRIPANAAHGGGARREAGGGGAPPAPPRPPRRGGTGPVAGRAVVAGVERGEAVAPRPHAAGQLGLRGATPQERRVRLADP